MTRHLAGSDSLPLVRAAAREAAIAACVRECVALYREAEERLAHRHDAFFARRRERELREHVREATGRRVWP